MNAKFGREVTLEKEVDQAIVLQRYIEKTNKHWNFQQDLKPTRKANTTQNWLQNSVFDFILTLKWPPHCPDINLLDYSIWAELEKGLLDRSFKFGLTQG